MDFPIEDVPAMITALQKVANIPVPPLLAYEENA